MYPHALRASALFLAVVVLSLILTTCTSQPRIACDAIGSCCQSLSSSLTSDACVAPEFLFATTQSGQILSFSVDRSSGTLGTPASTAGPATSLGLTSRGNFTLFASDSQNNAIAAFAIDGGSGGLTAVVGSPFSLGSIAGEPTGLTMGPANFLYAANNNGSVNAFSVARDGSLSQIPSSPFPAGTTPAEIVFGQSPQGSTPPNFVYVTNSGDLLGTISGYSIDTASGNLTPVPGSPFTTSLNSRPTGILFDSFNDAVDGPYVYVALSQASGVAGFSVDRNTGALTPVPGSPFPGVNLPMGLAQYQSFLFAGNNDQTISVFSITQSTGALTPVSGSPFSTGTLPGSLVVGGQTLYAPQAGASGIVALSINPSTGGLAPISGSAFSAPSAPALLSAGP